MIHKSTLKVLPVNVYLPEKACPVSFAKAIRGGKIKENSNLIQTGCFFVPTAKTLIYPLILL
jgi:hypothetical protein